YRGRKIANLPLHGRLILARVERRRPCAGLRSGSGIRKLVRAGPDCPARAAKDRRLLPRRMPGVLFAASLIPGVAARPFGPPERRWFRCVGPANNWRAHPPAV